VSLVLREAEGLRRACSAVLTLCSVGGVVSYSGRRGPVDTDRARWLGGGRAVGALWGEKAQIPGLSGVRNIFGKGPCWGGKYQIADEREFLVPDQSEIAMNPSIAPGNLPDILYKKTIITHTHRLLGSITAGDITDGHKSIRADNSQ